ncbi:GGDEF domain-containing protein [Streptomyces sp. SBT349]|uniref:GGDEF domain-containing protein n=1 Tax=Streptomyces sp. SBT349 TaxID=1580539 RepID=UPI00066BB0BE|nr:GGDEF domain-containing protein [Streptomyces sp. SBT349]
MSTLLPAAAAALPLAGGWSVHAAMLRRRLDTARRDPLSGLHRREGFEQAASRLLARGPLVVAVIDLDGFKQVNDTFGHAAGDAVIAATGARLAEHVGAHGVAGRLGGDEFAAAFPLKPAGLPGELAALHTALCRPVPHEDVPLLFVGASVGGVLAPVGTALGVALRVADEAMFGAKQTGGGPSVAPGLTPVYRTVNGRRDGRRGTGLEGGAA